MDAGILQGPIRINQPEEAIALRMVVFIVDRSASELCGVVDERHVGWCTQSDVTIGEIQRSPVRRAVSCSKHNCLIQIYYSLYCNYDGTRCRSKIALYYFDV